MSRGRGRGGAGAGRGRGGSYRIAGYDLPYDPDLTFDDKPTPTPLFPKYKPVPPKPLTKDERIQVSRFRSLRERIHEGPLYTVLGDNVRVGKPGSSSVAQFDPFEGMPTYSQKYTRKKNKIPRLDTRPYVLKFFPKELWSTIEPTQANAHRASPDVKKKKLQIGDLKRPNGLSAYGRELSGEPQDQKTNQSKNAHDHLANAEDDEDTPMEPGDEEAPLEEEEVDDNYEEDEEDMGGDYDAERYFDDGGDDAGDDYDGGGGAGGDEGEY